MIQCKSLGELGLHVATIPATLARLLEGSGVKAEDILHHPQPSSLEQILEAWKQTLTSVRQKLAKTSEPDGSWSINHQGKELATLPKSVARRTFKLNH